jgi:UDP-glucose 4-epimerase
MKPTILVLGAAGFLGVNLLKELVQSGKKVRVLARPSFSLSRLREFQDKIDLVVGDFQDDAIVNHALEGIETVYHLITTTFPSMTVQSGVYDVSTNLIPTIRLLEGCKKMGVKRVIYASSGGTIYGIPSQIPIREDHPLMPISFYGQSKLMVENYLGFFTRVNDLTVHIMRVSNPYGEGQKPFGVQGVVAAAMNAALTGTPLKVIGKGKTVRDYIYAGDVIQALIAVSKVKKPQVLNISSGQGKTVLEIVEQIEKISGIKIKKKMVSARSSDVEKNILDNTLAQKTIHWKPTTSLEWGLQKTWEWMKRRAG